jgi:hypothetical protein
MLGPVPAPLGFLDFFPNQVNPENLVTNDWLIGREYAINATLDFNSPITVVNNVNCTHCYVAGNTTIYYKFATYNSSDSSTWLDLSDVYPMTSVEMATTYDGIATLGGIWGQDNWINTVNVNNPIKSDLTFFYADYFPAISATYGYDSVIGLGLASQSDVVPEGSNFVQRLFDGGFINERVARLSYGWDQPTQVQLGRNDPSFPNTYTGNLVDFTPASNANLQGWGLDIESLTYGSSNLNILEGTTASFVMSPFIWIPDQAFYELEAQLPASFMKNTAT